MTVLTANDIRGYCEPLSIRVVTAGVPRLSFERCSDCRVYVGTFADAANAAFVTAATMIAPERDDFKGALVWVTRRDRSFDNCEAAFARVRKGFGTDAPSDERPGHLFDYGEFADAVVMLGFLMTFQWDAIWVPAHGEYLMSVNHDNFIDFAVRGGRGRWDTDRKELFDNLSFRQWPQMTAYYCATATTGQVPTAQPPRPGGPVDLAGWWSTETPL